MKSMKVVTLVASVSLVAVLALVGCASSGSGSAASKSASASAASASAASASATASPSSAAASAASAAASASSAAASSASAAASASAPAASASAPAAPAAQSGNSYIGNDAAKAAALEHAGVAEADCTEMKVELDTDDSVVHYDVEFKVGNTEYDYDIDPTTGDIIKSDSEIDND